MGYSETAGKILLRKASGSLHRSTKEENRAGLSPPHPRGNIHTHFFSRPLNQYETIFDIRPVSQLISDRIQFQVLNLNGNLVPIKVCILSVKRRRI